MDFFRRLFGKKEEASKEGILAVEAELGKKVKGGVQTAPLNPDETMASRQEIQELEHNTPTTPVEPVMQGPIQTRPLPPPKAFKSKHRTLRYGSVSDVGGRANNEDSSLALVTNAKMATDPPIVGLFMVADGMGGHENGEYASASTVQTVARYVLEEVVLPMMEGQERNAEQKTIPEVLAEALSAANSLVQANYPGGGTTATCAIVRGDLAYIAHVGDSRAYLINEGMLELVTRDHLLVRRLEELGQLSREEADIHPQRNVLYRAIGQADALEVDAATRRLPPSSRLLLCSDGLWGVIGDGGMMRILNETEDPQEACERLIAEANALGGPDNITAIILQMPD